MYRGQQRIAALDPRDRGLAYGDGLFETILVHAGTPVWWDAHWQRLARGCEVLGMALPDPAFVRRQADELATGCARGVLKLSLTRGIGERGYAPPADAVPTLLLDLGAAPAAPPVAGLHLRWCDTRLSIQPRLAGIKHLNRLEQVLARAEWSDPDIHEGLLRDTSGRVVSATAANLFVLREGRWLTPRIDGCGVAGICRAWLLDHVAGADETDLSVAAVETADAVILCNAVRGILPVAALEGRRWAIGTPVRVLLHAMAEAEPAFAHR
ncbi:MAG: aminodeoxychorismate lyase [Proteobacteria bacterium]|nr:aminodeoxychorismate lyase [Pseudomonadota bacterium]